MWDTLSLDSFFYFSLCTKDTILSDDLAGAKKNRGLDFFCNSIFFSQEDHTDQRNLCSCKPFSIDDRYFEMKGEKKEG